MLSKLDAALAVVPFDTVATLVAFGAEQAFLWVGQEPKSTEEFYFELGRKVARMKDEFWQRELERHNECSPE